MPNAIANFGALRRPTEASQYVLIKYRDRLREAGPVPFVVDLYDNALVETINGLYKSEVIWRRGPWRSIEVVDFVILEWGDWFKNRRDSRRLDTCRRLKQKYSTMPATRS